MTSRSNWLTAKVVSEGYCCLHGYLRLCKARDEKVRDMAKNINISPDALWYHYRNTRHNCGPVCQRFSDCMGSVIQIIEDEKKPDNSPGLDE